MNLSDFKNLIENNPVALATITDENKPNVIGVASIKVISENQVLITDNYMSQTLKDILKNKNVCLSVWDRSLKGAKLVGEAEYFTAGKWKKFVEKMPENKGLPAILVSVSKIIESK